MAISYPYPVLGNGDDISLGAVAPTISYTVTDQLLEIVVDGLKAGNPDLDGLVVGGRAKWSIRVQCARTYFRREFASVDEKCRINIDGTSVYGRVEVQPMLYASEPIGAYAPSGAHSDYAGTTFEVERGGLLAFGPVSAFEVEKGFDPLKAPAASIMTIERGDRPSGPFVVDVEDDLIRIILSHEDWDLYGSVKEGVPDVLHPALVVPALCKALPQLGASEGRKWSDRLRAMVEARGIDLADHLTAAQALLAFPLTRAFRGLKAKLEGEN